MNQYFSRGILSGITPVVKNIIIINVIIFIATQLMPDFMYEKFSLFYFGSPLFQPYQIISHMFMHGGFTHIFFNMWTLYFFGVALERVWGSQKFLLYYMVTGVGAALLHNGVMFLEASNLQAAAQAGNFSAYQSLQVLFHTPTVGASGAIYGLLLAYAMLFPNNIIQLLIPPIPLKAKYFAIIFGVLEFLLGITNKGGSIAHFAHLGGMLFGLVLILYWKKKNRMYY